MTTFDHHVGSTDASAALAKLLPMLLDPDMDADDIAREFLASPQQIAHWSSLPKLRDVLAALRDIYSLRMEILLLKARVGALSTLEQIFRAGETSGRGAETTRRAATTILKLKLDTTPPASPIPDPPPKGEMPRPSGGAAVGATSPSTSPAPSPSASPRATDRHPQGEIRRSSGGTAEGASSPKGSSASSAYAADRPCCPPLCSIDSRTNHRSVLKHANPSPAAARPPPPAGEDCRRWRRWTLARWTE